MSSKSEKVLVIGISGMDYKVTKGLMAAGKLPHFQQLAEEGSFLRCDTSIPSESTVAWHSIATGLSPQQHQWFDLVSRDPLTYSPKLIAMDQNNNDYFWNNIKHPGLFISTRCWPAKNLFSDILENTDYKLDLLKLVNTVVEREQALQQQFRKELTEFDHFRQGLLMIRFDGCQLLQQLFWKDLTLGKKTDKIILHQRIVDYYQEKDGWLGQVVSKLNPDINVVVISNHGVTGWERAVGLNFWLLQQGFLQLIPEIEPSTGKALVQVADWNTTRVYALGFNSLYLNCEGREGSGAVQYREPLLKELIGKLEKLVDPATNERIIHQAYRPDELGMVKNWQSTPDLIIGFNPGFAMAWSTVTAGIDSCFLQDNLGPFYGTNNVDAVFVPGIFFSNQKVDGTTISCLDLAPSILSRLNLTVHSEMKGRSLF